MKKGRWKRAVVPGLICVVLLVMACGCDELLEELSKIDMFQWKNVPLVSQETRMWCWAASGEMVMDFYGTHVDQCTQANNRFGRSDCCGIALCPNPVGTHACVTGGWPEFGRYGFNVKTTSDAALSWNNLVTEVTTRPFCFAWHWPGGGGHMMVARGAMIREELQFVAVNDPWPPCVGDSAFVAYGFYNTWPGDHTHWDDYYEVIPKP